MIKATYHAADQNFADETTIYWFEVEGLDVEGFEFDGLYGVVEGRNAGIVHDDGAPVLNDYVRDAVERAAEITDEIRADAAGI